MPANATAFKAITAYAACHNITPIRQGLTCPWHQNGCCAVYEVRPFICRRFGHTQNLLCRHGGKFTLWSPGKARSELARERELARTSGIVYLHQACYSNKEIAQMLSDHAAKTTAATPCESPAVEPPAQTPKVTES